MLRFIRKITQANNKKERKNLDSIRITKRVILPWKIWHWKIRSERKLKWKATKNPEHFFLRWKETNFFPFSWTCHALFHRLFSVYSFEFLELVDDARLMEIPSYGKAKNIFMTIFLFNLSTFLKKTSQFWLCCCCCCVKEFLILILLPSRTHRHKSAFLELPGINPGEWAQISIALEFQLCQSAERRWEIQLMLSSVFFFRLVPWQRRRGKANERRKLTNEREKKNWNLFNIYKTWWIMPRRFVLNSNDLFMALELYEPKHQTPKRKEKKSIILDAWKILSRLLLLLPGLYKHLDSTEKAFTEKKEHEIQPETKK